MRLPTAQQKRPNATFRLLSGMKFRSRCQAARLKSRLISKASRRRRKPLMTCFCRSKGSSSERSEHGKTKCDLVGEEATRRRVWGIDFRFARNTRPLYTEGTAFARKCARLSLFLFFIGDVFHQIPRLTLQFLTHSIDDIDRQFLDCSCTDCGNSRRADACALRKFFLRHLIDSKQNLYFELYHTTTPFCLLL